MPSTETDRLSGLTTSVAVKAPVRAATTANITLSGLQGVDGVSLAEGDRVLVKNQTSSADNGIYVASVSTWARALDFDGNRDAVNGTSVLVYSGSVAGSHWYQVSFAASPPTIGSTTMSWSQTFIAASNVAASETVSGIAELATQAESDTGTDDLRIVTPLKARKSNKDSFTIPVTTETGAVATGTGKVTFRMPYAFTVTDVRGSLKTAQSSGTILTVDVNESGTSIISTKLTIDNTEKTSTTAAAPIVISDASIADDAEITIDVDQIGDGTAIGLKVTLIGYRS